MSIQSSAVLVRLNISTWAARKKDKEQSAEVAARTGADSKAGNYTKDLMVGTRHVKQLNDFAARCRLDYNYQTLPWDDRGDRVLPTSLVFDFKEEHNEKRDNFYRQRDYICEHRDELVQVAANYLGAMYNPADYPTADEIWEKYKWSLTMKPIPDSGHLCLDLPAQDLEDLRVELERENNDKLKAATETAWKRLHGMLEGMSQKLTESDDGKDKRFHGTFITNPRDLCDLLSHLNITNDPDLEQAKQMLEASLAHANVDVLRESPHTREHMKSKVDEILEKFEW
jgi:hypothetical protein